MNRRSLLVLCLALPTLSFGQTTLRLNLQSGRTYNYRMTMNMDQAMMGKIGQTSTLSAKVVKKAGANTTVAMTTKDMKFNVPKGSPMERFAKDMAKANSTMTATYNNRGMQVGKMTLTGTDAASKSMASAMSGMSVGFMGLEFPAGPANVGSSWTTKMDIAKMMGAGAGQTAPGAKVTGKPLVIKYTLKSFGTKNGKRVANIAHSTAGNMTMSMPQGKGGGMGDITMAIKMSGTYSVDLATGLIVTGSSDMTTDITKPMKMTQKMSMTITQK